MNKFLITALIGLTTTYATAQTASLEGLKQFHSSGITPIFDGKECRGYTLFYRADKADKGNDNYVLSIYDENLTKTKSITMAKPRGKFLCLGNGYNGNLIAFYFYNLKAEQFEIDAYDLTLKKVATRILNEELTNMEKAMIQMKLQNDDKDDSPSSTDLTLYAVPEKGFIKNGVLKMGRGFTFEMFGNDLKTKWKYTSPDQKIYESFMVNEVTKKYLIGMTIRRKGLLSKEMNFFITMFDLETGKIALEIPAEDPNAKDQLSINTVKFDSVENKLIIIGDFYGESDKPGASKSKGFYIKSFDLTGKETNKKFYAWDKDLKTMLPSEAKESVEQGAMNFTHRALRGKDGKYYLICEQFSKKADALGIASSALGMLSGGGSGSNVHAAVYNMLIYVLNPDFTMAEIKFYPKDKSIVGMPPGSEYLKAGFFGYMIKYVGGFDYQFTQVSNDGSSYDVVYVDYDKEKGEATKVILGNILISPEGKFNIDKMDITTKSNASYLYPAKPGYLMMVDYLKKSKSVGMKMVKLNY